MFFHVGGKAGLIFEKAKVAQLVHLVEADHRYAQVFLELRELLPGGCKK